MRISDWSSDVCSSDLSVTPLDRQRHASHGVRLPHSYAWCSQTKAVPINVEEFAVAALQMPIAFVIDATGRHDVAAVLALHGDRNAFVDPDGRWLAEHYVPAYLRRFPFCSFVHGAAAQTKDRKRVVSGKSVSVRLDLGGTR